MNEDPRVSETLGDDLVIDLLDRLNASSLPGPLALEQAASDSDRRLQRGYLEILGLLPYELGLMQPSAATKGRILAGLGGAGATTLVERKAPPAEVGANWIPGGWQGWLLPLAASLVLLLAGFSGWQHLQMSRQLAEMTRFQQELQAAQSKLAVLAASGVEVCSLRPMEEHFADSSPTATLFVAPDHQHWYLRIDGLGPSPEDHAYQLWFITDQGAQVSAGTFDTQTGSRIELTSATMPGGTVAVSVTVEPIGGSESPSGPPLLYGDELMRIL